MHSYRIEPQIDTLFYDGSVSLDEGWSLHEDQTLLTSLTYKIYLLSVNVRDALDLSIPCPPSIVIWYLELYFSPEYSVDTENSSWSHSLWESGSMVSTPSSPLI